MPVMVNPNPFVPTPKLAAAVCICGFQSTAERPIQGTGAGVTIGGGGQAIVLSISILTSSAVEA
jgi:hypothetical protein